MLLLSVVIELYKTTPTMMMIELGIRLRALQKEIK